jgi:hypothetical protein
MLTLDGAIQSIQAAMTPAILFTASGLLLAGLQNKYSSLIQAVRALNDERRELLQKPNASDLEKARAKGIGKQIPHLLKRAQLVRNAVFFLYLGTLLFLLSSFIIGMSHVGLPVMAHAVVALFVVGLVGLIVGILYALAEARLSYRVVRLEVGLETS